MERKLYKCNRCDREVYIRSRGLCQRCRYLQRVENNEIKTKIKRDNSNRKEILSEFFNYHLEQIKKNPYCENCGGYINSGICNIAHILPKRKMGGNPEVMGELNNCLYLCSSFDKTDMDCHSRYDRIQGSSKVYLMSCFSKAVEKYLTFKDQVRYNKYVSVFEDYLKEQKNEI